MHERDRAGGASDGGGFGWWPFLRLTLAAVMVVVLVTAGLAIPTLAFPQTVAAPKDVDAVVVLAGGQGERLDTALRIMERASGPPAPVLWISNGDDPDWPQAHDLCGTDQGDYEVRCFRPVPDTTQGEARALAALAGRERWVGVGVVTSTYHVSRARLWLDRCYGGFVQAVAATPDLPWADLMRVSARELAAHGRDRFLATTC